MKIAFSIFDFNEDGFIDELDIHCVMKLCDLDALKGDEKDQEHIKKMFKRSDKTKKVEKCMTDFELTMHSFICEVNSKELSLHEHIDQQWLKVNELTKLDWAAADLPIVKKLLV